MIRTVTNSRLILAQWPDLPRGRDPVMNLHFPVTTGHVARPAVWPDLPCGPTCRVARPAVWPEVGIGV